MIRSQGSDGPSSTDRARRRRRFTLVEAGLVLAIVGLVVGGVLGGRILIKNVRISSTLETLRTAASAIRAYRQTYQALPGDDREAAARFGATTPQANGASDGTIDGSYNSTTPDQESRVAWAHLRAAGLFGGLATDQEPPVNRFGGVFGIADSPLGLSGTAVCASNIPGDAANVIDTKMDDGNRNTGSVRVLQTPGAAPNLSGMPQPGPIPEADEDKAHVLCIRAL